MSTSWVLIVGYVGFTAVISTSLCGLPTLSGTCKDYHCLLCAGKRNLVSIRFNFSIQDGWFCPSHLFATSITDSHPDFMFTINFFHSPYSFLEISLLVSTSEDFSEPSKGPIFKLYRRFGSLNLRANVFILGY